MATDHDNRADARAVADLLARPVTITLTRVSLMRAIDSVARVAGVVVQYQVPTLREHTMPITLDVTGVPLGVVFERVLDGTNLRVVPDGPDGLSVIPLAESAADSVLPGAIAGRVVDSTSGKGVNGAAVKLAGTKLSTVTSDSGKFVFPSVPAGEQTVFVKVFGYRPAQRTVTVASNERTTLRMPLAAAPNLLTGVVTTAAGEQDRRTIGNDITVINADSVMRVAPIKTVTDLLETRVPGLTVQHSSGIPGAPSRIRLRGVGGGLIAGASNTSNDPIVIVDGVRIYAHQSTNRDRNLAARVDNANLGLTDKYPDPSPLDQIDPNSIEKIEVFKGPSATSQWGSDAGNGVIVITTKRGQVGPTRISVVLNGDIEQMPGVYAKEAYYPYGKTGWSDDNPSVPCTIFPNAIDFSGADVTPYCVRLDSVMRHQLSNISRFSSFGLGTHQGGSTTISGGASTMNYSLTGSLDNTIGYLKLPRFYRDKYSERFGTQAPGWMTRPDKYAQSGVTAAFGLIPSSGFALRFNASLSNSVSNQAAAQDILSSLSGAYFDTLTNNPTDGLNTPFLFPSSMLERSVSDAGTTTLGGSADWTRWRGVFVQGSIGMSTAERYDRTWVPYTVDTGQAVATVGYFTVGRGFASTQTATMNATLFPGAKAQTVFGVQFVRSSTNDISAAKDTLSPGVIVPSVLHDASQSASATTTTGWFVEPRIRLSDRFNLTPGFRFDGGSAATGGGVKGGGVLSGGLFSGVMAFFPKLNLSWIAVDRSDGAPFAGIVTLLRPRVSFGVAGVQPDPGWNFRLLHADTLTNYLYLGTLGNTQLHPERSREIEGGFDATLWGGRANLTVTKARKIRIDAIESFTTAPSIYGGQTYYRNIGRVLNKTTELSFDARLLETPLLAWGVHANYSAYHNMVTRLNDTSGSVNRGDGTYLVKGYPIGGRWVRPILGYFDVNGDHKIQITEVTVGDKLVYVGDGQPDAEIPFGTNLSLWHGKIGITAEFDYKNGITQYNLGGKQALSNLYSNPSASFGEQAVAIAAALDGVLLNASNGVVTSGQGTNYGLFQTVSVMRFTSVSINYSVPISVSKRLHVPNISLAVQGRNLGLWSNYRGKDPDVSSSIIGEDITDTGQAPLPRDWSLRIVLGN